MWQEVLIRKSLPPSEIRLAMIVQDSNLTEKALASIKEYTDSNRELPLAYRKMMNNLTRMTPEDGLKRVLASFPMPSKISDSEIMQNYRKLLDAGGLKSHDNIENIVDAGLKAYNDGNMEQFSKIQAKVSKLPKLSKNQRSKNKKLVSKLSYFKSLAPTWTLKFKNKMPEGKKEGDFVKDIQEFVEKANKSLKSLHMGDKKPEMSIKNDEIITHVGNPTDFMKFLKNTEGMREIYATNLRLYGPDLESVKDITSNLSEIDAFIGQNEKMTPINIRTYTHVVNYLAALAAITGDVKKFIPKKFNNGNNYPRSAILTRTSGASTSLVLNPYLYIIISNTFDDKWYDQIFKGIRMRGFTSDKLARSIVIKDIYDKLKEDTSEGEESTYGVNLNIFNEIKPDLKTGTDKANLKKLREYIETYPTVKNEINRFAITYQENRLDELNKYFTLSEIESIKEWWDSLDEEMKEDIEEEEGDFGIRYKTYEGKEVESIKDEKAYAVVLFDDEELGPNDFQTRLNRIKESLDIGEIGTDEKQDAFKQLRRVMFSESDKVSKFTNLLLSFEKENDSDNPLTRILLQTEQDAANYMDKLSPENSLRFLGKLSPRLTGSGIDIAATFKAIYAVEGNEKIKLAEELNKKMPNFLNKAKSELIGGFDLTLKDFAKNPENYNTERKFNKVIRSSAIVAKEKFKEVNLLSD